MCAALALPSPHVTTEVGVHPLLSRLPSRSLSLWPGSSYRRSKWLSLWVRIWRECLAEGFEPAVLRCSDQTSYSHTRRAQNRRAAPSRIGPVPGSVAISMSMALRVYQAASLEDAVSQPPVTGRAESVPALSKRAP